MGNPPPEVAPGQRKIHVNSYRRQTVHRGKVDPGVSEFPWGNELSRDHVNRPLVDIAALLYALWPLSAWDIWITRSQEFCRHSKTYLNLIRPRGGAQRPGWPNSQLPIRLSNDAQTWWLLVFILETPFGHILAKLVNQGGCCCSFLIETSQKFWKWKTFPMLENCWNWHGGSILGREERFWT